VTRWFDRLKIPQKLVVMALLVTTPVLAVATAGLVGLDLFRLRSTAQEDTAALAHVIAENTAAAVLFSDPDDARQTLASVRARPTVTRACLYRTDGTLFAAWNRPGAPGCPSAQPDPQAWSIVTGTAPVVRNDVIVGTVYVERELSEIRARVMLVGLAALAILLVASGVAFIVAHRLQRTVSEPIRRLAAAARTIESEAPESLTGLPDGPDEVGDLARSFTDMLRRVREATDALKRKELEREQLLASERQANRLKDEFLAAVSHELRTPLNAILGWIQILGTTPADEHMRARALASIGRNARAQRRVIEDLVDVSRIVTGKLNLRLEALDVRLPVEAAVDVMRPAAEGKQIGLDLEMPDRPCPVSGDRDRLQQVIWNLVSNAVKFSTPGGRVRVTVEASTDGYAVSVADNGPGIAPEFLPFVFDRFRQADGSMTREHGGLGLGLAIVKDLTERHGGTVTVSSTSPGQGTTFTVRLPTLQAGAPRQGDAPGTEALATNRTEAVPEPAPAQVRGELEERP
jgi:signal transduction histidine kinase